VLGSGGRYEDGLMVDGSPCASSARSTARRTGAWPTLTIPSTGTPTASATLTDPAWKERYRVRDGVEGTLSQGARAFGMRRSRYIGLAKTGLQEACAAAGMDALRAVRWLEGLPLAGTRVTRFASLAQAA